MNNLAQSRPAILAAINQQECYDILIIGGGIHGAVLAKQAAQVGWKVLLLEQHDYAAATSSRSSKMAHGGLRYLELFDFQQVFEGVKSRDALYRSYPELVKPHPFYIPVASKDWFFKLKLGVGLQLYDLLLSNKSLRHHWLSTAAVVANIPELEQQKLAGCYCYYDGIMNDSALVLANILAARCSSADCLNYAQVEKVSPCASNQLSEIVWRDLLTGTQQQVSSRVVVNCCGPWATTFSPAPVVYSRGSHIIFSKPWNKPALFLPMPGKARYYFVWPHFAGTLVGTTERPVTELELDPLPAKDEIEEIYDRLAKDLPASGLNRQTAHYAFAGIRTMPLQGHTEASRLSRKHRWLQEHSLFSLIGGKFTTAEWTAREGLKQIQKYLVRCGGHQAAGVSRGDISQELILPTSDFETAFRQQQVATLEDFMRRRSGWEYLPDHGQAQLEQQAETCAKNLGAAVFEKQRQAYFERMQTIKQLLV